MTIETELSKMWLEAWMLKQQGKNVVLHGGEPLTSALEKRVFEEADKRIDETIKEGKVKKGEVVLFDRKKMEKEAGLLHEEVLEKKGAFERIRRWYKGWRPEIEGGVLIMGSTGKETFIEETIIRPKRTFMVKNNVSRK